ncbi:COX15/CtaA family protein [Chengkuizengella axinellae]|uniref:COX15/CtaA family protein n=1 Tax=Chengkuizengella axinellae TaxID=3064388 RepID=A0ABT9IUL9_9BACL|nr:COX15/CtaA family protein [Chengkuizengella sp. 2205SS18-9]MDP5272564.1 COX15/CtaA family protein [Chengkuizengella sp. 2205SS18-9]
MGKGLKWLATITSIGMFIVLLAGTLVTNTGSELGCGHDWPLCNGKFIPSFTISTMIEYSHRAVTGIEGILVLLTLVLVIRTLKHRKDALLYAWGTLFFTVVQAIMGAMAVKWPQSDPVLALHFGISSLAFASSLLLAMIIWKIDKEDQKLYTKWGEPITIDHKPVGKSYRIFVWLTVIYAYIVIYTGALVKHTESGSAFVQLFQNTFQTLFGKVGVALTHIFSASLLFVFMLIVAHFAYRTYHHIEPIRKAGLVSLALIVAQIISGVLLVVAISNDTWYLIAIMLHTSIISALFGVLCYLCMLVWQWREKI